MEAICSEHQLRGKASADGDALSFSSLTRNILSLDFVGRALKDLPEKVAVGLLTHLILAAIIS